MHTPSVAIVSTSINSRPKAYEAWARQGDLIVAGDKNSPDDLEAFVRDLGGTYLRPVDQEDWSFSPYLPWNCVQRRNAAIMYAYEHKYDYVATVDDDNMPMNDDWVSAHIAHLQGIFNEVTCSVTGQFRGDMGAWVDIGRFTTPRVKQRGTPFGVVTNDNFSRNRDTWPKCVVSTAPVMNNPDCDAVTRLTSDPIVTDVQMNVIVHPDQWAAFNSQATVWRGDWAPMMCCLPYVGRYDDIFASFLTKAVMMVNRVSFYAGTPWVTQDRNPHDAIHDLRNEVFGLEATPVFIANLASSLIRYGVIPMLSEQYSDAYKSIRNVLPAATVDFMHRWIEHWMTLESRRREGTVK